MTKVNKRVQVYYSGRVQGVGFRFTAERLATDLGLGGWVKNLADGRVELVGEGTEQQLGRLLTKIDQQLAGYINGKKLNWLPANGEFSDFKIRFY